MCEIIRCAVDGETVAKQRSLNLDKRSSEVCDKMMKVAVSIRMLSS